MAPRKPKNTTVRGPTRLTLVHHAAAAGGRAPRKSVAHKMAKPKVVKSRAENSQVLLATAEARISELEARLRNLVGRMNWIADRLHEVLDDRHD